MLNIVGLSRGIYGSALHCHDGGSFDEDHSNESRQGVTVNHRLDHYFSHLYLSGTRPIAVPVLRARSTEMSDCDRELVLETTRNLLEEGSPIVIIHDTD